MINNDEYLSRHTEKFRGIIMGQLCPQFSIVKIYSKFFFFLAIDGLVAQATIRNEVYYLLEHIRYFLLADLLIILSTASLISAYTHALISSYLNKTFSWSHIPTSSDSQISYAPYSKTSWKIMNTCWLLFLFASLLLNQLTLSELHQHCSCEVHQWLIYS